MIWFYGAHQHSAPVDHVAVNPDLVAALLEASNSIWLAKLFNVGALTFVSWDIVLTLDDEVEYVWKSRWNPIRALYMIVRYFILFSISMDSIILFHPTISPGSCDVVIRIGTTLSLVGMAATMLLLLVRVWVMWYKDLWVLIALLASFFTLQIASISMLIPGVYMMSAIENPLPGILTGCAVPFTAKVHWIWPLLCGLIYETILFGLTIYQAWRLNRERIRAPILTHLVLDGVLYFLVVFTVALLTIIGTTNPKTLRAAIGSGMFPGVTSAMCCRLVLRLRSYVYAVPSLSVIENDFPMTALPSHSRSELL
ncbi:hypothetical protein BDV93DRAFT_523300 [Ceratobasidium sp. AG-I]|nr:hypothetical protein BDV93DRAFT_523300 [Ceratobasidium sp. AG-I]